MHGHSCSDGSARVFRAVSIASVPRTDSDGLSRPLLHAEVNSAPPARHDFVKPERPSKQQPGTRRKNRPTASGMILVPGKENHVNEHSAPTQHTGRRHTFSFVLNISALGTFVWMLVCIDPKECRPTVVAPHVLFGILYLAYWIHIFCGETLTSLNNINAAASFPLYANRYVMNHRHGHAHSGILLFREVFHVQRLFTIFFNSDSSTYHCQVGRDSLHLLVLHLLLARKNGNIRGRGERFQRQLSGREQDAQSSCRDLPPQLFSAAELVTNNRPIRFASRVAEPRSRGDGSRSHRVLHAGMF